MTNRQSPPPGQGHDDIVVFRVRRREGKCDECGDEIHRRGLLRKEGDRGLCIECADLGDLVFLPSGDAAVTRRASKYSKIRAVVVEWSRTRKRYERQGILVEEEALDRAELESLADAESRERRREREAMRRAAIDASYVARFAKEIRKHFPSAPKGIEARIAEHACRKYSGRVGRSAAAKEFDAKMIDLAVQAHTRHVNTNYDNLLASGYERWEAREVVRGTVDELMDRWRGA